MAAFQCNVHICRGAGPCNEDRVGYVGDTAWVIDGATGVGDRLTAADSDAAWLAQTASDAFAELARTRPDLALEEMVRAAIERCRAAFRTARIAPAPTGPAIDEVLPSAAFVLARARGGRVRIVSLADCDAILARDGTPELIDAGGISADEARTAAAAGEILARRPELDGAELIARLQPRMRASRRRMNQPGGYWILGLDPRAADHLKSVDLPIADGQDLVLASDGFVRLIDVFGVATPADLLAARGKARAHEWLDRLRELESAPDSRRTFPRVKRHDDASFLHLTYREG